MEIYGPQNILERDGGPIYYWLSGPENAPLIVFTHGAQGDHKMFKAQIEILTQHYRVLTWDLRGHGLSQPLRGELSYRSTAQDILALIDRVAAERAILAGHSLGGCAAQELAYLHPERVSALVLIGSPCVTAPCPPSIHNSQRMLLTIGRLLPEKAFKQFMLGAANSYSIVAEVQEYIREATLQLSKPTLLAISQAVLQSFHAEPDYRIMQPFLLAHGDQDADVIQQETAAWAKRESNCRYSVIPDAGHNAHQDNPANFNRQLTTFLQEFAA